LYTKSKNAKVATTGELNGKTQPIWHKRRHLCGLRDWTLWAVPKMIAGNIEHLIGKRLATGEWSVTGRLPSDRDLAAQYGVARNTIRKALKAIAAEGNVERQVGRGTFLRNNQATDLSTIMKCVIGASPADLITVRRLIEPQAAALAAKNASSSDFEAIVEAHRRASEASHPEKFDNWDSQFHRRVFVASRNELLIHINDILRGVRSQRSFAASRSDNLSLDIQRHSFFCYQHANVVAMLKRRDADAAARAMRRHIKEVEVAAFGVR
jgi:DNA-binding FadR family transcriptional regulator